MAQRLQKSPGTGSAIKVVVLNAEVLVTTSWTFVNENSSFWGRTENEYGTPCA
jgi:hypothetical protein